MFTAAESAEVWDRWQQGAGINLIGRTIGRWHTAVFNHLKPHGAIRPVLRRRSRRALSLDDHEEIARGMAVGVSLRSVARALGRAIRRSRHATNKGVRGHIIDAISIRGRPASVEDRAIPGHWEGDLLCCSSNSYIVTLVERYSRYVMLANVANRSLLSVLIF